MTPIPIMTQNGGILISKKRTHGKYIFWKGWAEWTLTDWWRKKNVPDVSHYPHAKCSCAHRCFFWKGLHKNMISLDFWIHFFSKLWYSFVIYFYKFNSINNKPVPVPTPFRAIWKVYVTDIVSCDMNLTFLKQWNALWLHLPRLLFLFFVVLSFNQLPSPYAIAPPFVKLRAFFICKFYKSITWLIAPTNCWMYEQPSANSISPFDHVQPYFSTLRFCMFCSRFHSLSRGRSNIQLLRKTNRVFFFTLCRRCTVWERISSLCFFRLYFFFRFRCSIRCCVVCGCAPGS